MYLKNLIPLFILILIIWLNCPGILQSADQGNVITSGYEFIRTDDSLFYSAHLLYYNNGNTVNYFLVNTGSGEKYFSSPEEFILSGRMGICYPLMNIDYPFLTFKDNVSRFIHPNFAIKFLYLIEKVGATQTISDAMRKSDEQLIYKRRGWTDVESSPHMYGLAADMVYYSAADRNWIQSKTSALDLRFLEHGGRGNRHIHLQDNEIWKHVKPVFDSLDCKVLNDSLCNKVIPTEKMVPSSAGYPSYDYKKYSFDVPVEGLLKLVFLDKFGNAAGEIRMGVFEPGRHEVYYNYDFLKEGAYTLRIFYNYEFLTAVPVFKG